MSTYFRDSSGEIRLVGTIFAPGATVGDVFTVQADGSLAPDAGGGSQPSPRWRNVKTYTYADVVALGNDVPDDLLTIPTNGLVDAYWLHSLVGFDDSGSIDAKFGWLLDSGTPRYLYSGTNVLIPQVGSEDDWAGVAGVAGDGQSSNAKLIPPNDDSISYGPLVLDAAVAGPLQIVFTSIAGDGTQGEFDLWLRIQDPA